MDYKVTDTELTSIANAIRTKGGTSDLLEFPTEFVEAIGDIHTGTFGTKTVTANGTYAASADNLDGFSSVTVAIPSFDSEAF